MARVWTRETITQELQRILMEVFVIEEGACGEQVRLYEDLDLDSASEAELQWEMEETFGFGSFQEDFGRMLNPLKRDDSPESVRGVLRELKRAFGLEIPEDLPDPQSFNLVPLYRGVYALLNVGHLVTYVECRLGL